MTKQAVVRVLPEGIPEQLIDNRYRPSEMLGRGSSAIVFAATNVITHKRVALKWPLQRGAFASAALEAQLASRVRSPHVVEIYDLGEHEGRFFLAMERIDGLSLAARVKSTRLTTSELEPILNAVLDGLAALHANGVVHGDVKAANIVTTSIHLGRVAAKLVDLGSARPAVAATSSEDIASSSGCSAEQGCDGWLLDARSDVLALGRLLLRLLAMQLVVGDPARLERLAAVARVAADRNPVGPFQSIEELRRALV